MGKSIKITEDLKRAIISFLRNKTLPDNLSEVCSKRPVDFKRMCKSFKFCDRRNLLLYVDKDGNELEVYTEAEKFHLDNRLMYFHEKLGCAGRDKFFSYIKTHIYGVTRNYCLEIIKKCNNCKVVNLERLPQEITQIESKYSRERIIADLVDLRKYSEDNDDFGWLFVAVDAFSKFAFTFALKSKTKEEVIVCFKKIIFRLGKVVIIHTDNGKEFQNNLLRQLCDDHGIKKVKGKARRPWVQGQVERLNRTLKEMIGKKLRTSGNGFRWIEIYEEITFHYNSMLHHTTRHSPFDVLFGGKLSKIIPPDHREKVLSCEECDGEDVDEEGQYEEMVFEPINNVQETEELNKRVKQNTLNKMDRTIRNRNQTIKRRSLEVGEKVFLRRTFDANRETKQLPFNEHLDYNVYVVIKVVKNGLYNIKRESDGEIIENVPTKNLKFNN